MRNKFTIKNILSILLIIVIILSVNTFVYARHTNSVSQNEISQKIWRDDIELLRKNLSDYHKNPFTIISEEEFNTQVDDLCDNLANLNDCEIKVQLMQIVASIGDAHTAIYFKQKYFTTVISSFDDGYYLLIGANDFKNYLGWKVVEINGIDIERCEEILSKLSAKKSQAAKNQDVAVYLCCPDISYGANIQKSLDTYRLTLEKNGKRKTVSYDHKDGAKYRYEFLEADNMLRFKDTRNNYYSIETYDGVDILYFRYNKCRNDDKYPTSDLVKKIIRDLSEKKVDKLVIDVSTNGGGRSGLLNPLIQYLDKSGLIEFGRIFVITGYKTFSSGILDTVGFLNGTNSIIIGSHTGDSLNHFGEVRSFKLEKIGAYVSYSIKKFRWNMRRGDPDGDAVYPDIQIPYNFEDIYERNEDLVLDAIIDFPIISFPEIRK